jgi:hypothetical protein
MESANNTTQTPTTEQKPEQNTESHTKTGDQSTNPEKPLLSKRQRKRQENKKIWESKKEERKQKMKVHTIIAKDIITVNRFTYRKTRRREKLKKTRKSSCWLLRKKK